jgi:hypothetical protein
VYAKFGSCVVYESDLLSLKAVPLGIDYAIKRRVF